MSKEDLKKNMQRVLEKHASGIMGRDLRRLYKEVRARHPATDELGVKFATLCGHSVLELGVPYAKSPRQEAVIRTAVSCFRFRMSIPLIVAGEWQRPAVGRFRGAAPYRARGKGAYRHRLLHARGDGRVVGLRCKCRTLPHLRWFLTESVQSVN